VPVLRVGQFAATGQGVVQCPGSCRSHAGDYRVSAGRVVLDSDSA